MVSFLLIACVFFPLFSENNLLQIQNDSRSLGKSCSQWYFVTGADWKFPNVPLRFKSTKEQSATRFMLTSVLMLELARYTGQDGKRRYIYPQTFCKVFETV